MDKVEFFKALGDPTRLDIVSLLVAQSPLCVCDVFTHLNKPQSTVSRHLNHLKRVGVVTSERRGTWMWYALHPDLPAWCLQVLDALSMEGFEHGQTDE